MYSIEIDTGQESYAFILFDIDANQSASTSI